MAVTLATALTVVIPFVLSGETIARLAPPCESKRLYGKECILCGTTTAFIAISHGDWETATQSNRLAIPLFTLFCANGVAAIAYFSMRRFGARRSP